MTIMNYISLNHNSKKVNFENALINGLAPDKGLYFPEYIPKLSTKLFKNIDNISNNEIAYKVIKPFVGNCVDKNNLIKIIEDTLSFEFPLKQINNLIYSLELFHGPTLAFKDVGARFMARFLGYINEKKRNKKITVLVATSGDTGGAVASGFNNIEGIDVVILYPKNKVSKIQEKQLTTLGNNIYALEVDGDFDECQNMAKNIFVDDQINNEIDITSANSINVGRWLPQTFYYFFAYKEIFKRGLTNKKNVFSVPSGNFGNICAGLLCKLMGLPINHFISSTNINNVVPIFLKTGQYKPKKTIKTISNAMDVGNPSNFIRIQNLYKNDFHKLKKIMSGYYFSDSQTSNEIYNIFKKHNYILDPHGAIGCLGLKKFLSSNENYFGVFLETAHPIKFLEIVEKKIKEKIPVPKQIKNILNKNGNKTPISNYNELKSFLLK